MGTVPYKGAGPAAQAVVAGDVSVTIAAVPAVQGFILYATTIYVLLFLAVDLLYLAIDPRLRTTRGRR